MSFVKKATFALLTNILLFGMIEAVLRITTTKPGDTRYAPVEFIANDFAMAVPGYPDLETLWRMPPRAPYFEMEERMNNIGFRGPDVSIEKPPNVRRAVLLGSSTVFGLYAPYTATFGHRLSRWLNSEHPSERWEVINLGIPNSSSFQSLQVLRTLGLRLKPDLVVVTCGTWHDYTAAVGFDDEAALAQMQRIDRHRKSIHARRLRLYQWICQIFARPHESRVAEYRRLWARNAVRPDGPRVSPTKFKKFLTAIAEESKKASARVIFVKPAANENVKKHTTDSDLYAEIVDRVARDEGCGLADAREAAEGNPDETHKYFKDDFHPSAFGHASIAELVALEILKLPFKDLPSTPPSTFRQVAIDLKELQQFAEHWVGPSASDALAPSEALRIDPAALSLPAPCRISYNRILIPSAATLEFDGAYYTRKDFSPEQAGSRPSRRTMDVRYRIVVSSEGLEPKTVFDKVFSAGDGNPWAKFPHQSADLSEFANHVSKIEFCVDNWTPRATFGLPKIFPLQ
jgi:lysophospholipase L1-like esterase